MKYILTEARLEEFIINYFEKNFDELNEAVAWDENGNETDCGMEFWKYNEENDDSETIFRLYQKCWWHKDSSERANEMYEQSPILTFERNTDLNTMNGYFGNKWIPIFKSWFESKYGFEIKTISGENFFS